MDIGGPQSRASIYRDGAWVPYAPPAADCASPATLPVERQTSDGEHCWVIEYQFLKGADAPDGVDSWWQLHRLPLGAQLYPGDESYVIAPEAVGLTPDHYFTLIDVADDGTVWASYGLLEGHGFEGLMWYDGESWTDVPFEASSSVADGWPSDLAVGPDGTVWLSRQHGGGLASVVSWDGSHWNELGPIEFPSDWTGHRKPRRFRRGWDALGHLPTARR